MPRRSPRHRSARPGPLRPGTVLAALALAPLALALAAPTTAAAPPEKPFVGGRASVARLGDRLPAVARENGMSRAQLRAALLADRTLKVDRSLQLAYFDEAADAGAPDPAPVAAAAPPTTDPVFSLSSLPGAEKTIYLDFDGNTTTGTTWNSAYGVETIENPPYDTDGDPTTFSATELAVVRNAYDVVAEDFAPWNVNVTTADPGTEALRRSGTGDTRWGVRVVVTSDTFASCGCGGHAYIGAFDDPTDEPAFVYNSGSRGVAEAATHEVGHTLLLAHDGTTSGDAYYRGHGTGETGWGPIMGASYSPSTVQWSQQEYTGANNNDAAANYNNGPDDVAIISSLTNGNGFGLRADDHGDTRATATALTGPTVTVSGRISTRTDVDVFSLSAAAGPVTVSATPPPAPVANLDLALTVRDSSGAVVASADAPTAHAATLTATLPAGDYTVSVDGVGAGSPTAVPPTGYTDYGSLGTYGLTARFTPATTADTTPPAAPTGLTATASGDVVALSWTANTEPDLAGYTVARASTAAGPFTTLASTTSPSFTDTAPLAGTNVYRVTASDTAGNVSAPSAPATVDRTPPSSGTVADGELAVVGVVTGTVADTRSADGVGQAVDEVSSGGKPNSRYDTLEHRWSFPATDGSLSLAVAATVLDGGDADSGMRLEWSRNGGTSWLPVTTLTGSVDSSFTLGTASGPVWVRVVDTDSTAGQLRPDTVRVDLLRIDAQPVAPASEAVVSALVAGTTSVTKSSAAGTATVTVTDEYGTPVAGARVGLRFSGAFSDTPTVTTDASGTARYTTAGSGTRRPSFQVCVVSVDAGPLAWTAGPVCRTV
ncbi:hypothetical protein [Phycicoccus flavus]|uniref:Fibronectin type-III domain-containing protein n=1 Tax=Phycicoccus flavus TaxID=2502783 RepID=A0A8T6R3W8_9MICO|nr:hypothetical protein [Phycicoccus flavus]NHA68536.1 hypothetical protein [Phycicoccus flavus]